MPKQKPSMRAVAAAAAAERERQAAVRRRRIAIGAGIGGVVLVVAIVVVVVLVSGKDDSAAPPRSDLAVQLGCASCHSTDGARAEGPTWQGLYGSTVTLADGSTVVADDAYLRRAITDPGAEIVSGFQDGMPAKAVTDAQVDQLIAFIKTLA
jgi:cytochrome c1